jgi:hypothetical protein
MKKVFSLLVFAMLCSVTSICNAQDSVYIDKSKTRSTDLGGYWQGFDISEDIRLMNLLTSALEKDGLIDTRKPYKLEIKDGEFYIDGTKQPKKVRDRFKKYFRKDSTDHYTIQNDGDRSTSPSNDDVIKEKRKSDLPSPETNILSFDGAKWQRDVQLMKQLIRGLQKEGLLESKKTYKLEVKDGELSINGTMQSKEVSEKFRKYFQSNNYALIND